MPLYSCTVGVRNFRFDSLKTLLARATPERSGDRLAGVAAATAEERVAAQMTLADVPLRQFLNEVVVPYEDDEVTRLIVDSHDATAFAAVAHLTVGGFANGCCRTKSTAWNWPPCLPASRPRWRRPSRRSCATRI